MNKKILLCFCILLVVNTLIFSTVEGESVFNFEGLTNELSSIEGANTNFYNNKENFNIDGDVNYNVGEGGEVILNSPKEGSAFIKGKEYDLSEGGELKLDKEGNILEGKDIAVSDDKDFELGENQKIEYIPKDSKFSFSKEEGTFSYTGPNGKETFEMSNVNFDKEMNIDLSDGMNEGAFDFSVGEGGGNMKIAGGDFTLPEGSYSSDKGVWDLSGATINKLPDFRANPEIDYRDFSKSGATSASLDMIMSGEDIKLSRELTGREGVSFSGPMGVSQGNFQILKGTTDTKLNNGISFDNLGGDKGHTTLFFKDDGSIKNYGKSSLLITEKELKGNSVDGNSISTIVFEKDNKYFGELMKEGGEEKWLAISSNRGGSYNLQGIREIDGKKYPPVLERTGGISIENGNRRYDTTSGKALYERKIPESISSKESNLNLKNKKTTPMIMVTEAGEKGKITSVFTEDGTTYHGYKSGIPIEESSIEEISTIKKQNPLGIPTRADPSAPYKISINDLNTDYKDRVISYQKSIESEKGLQNTLKPKFKNELEKELTKREADEIINRLETAKTNQEVSNIVDAYKAKTGKTLPSFSGNERHDKNLLNIEKNLEYLKKQGLLDESNYEKRTSLGINERNLINSKMEQGMSFEEAFKEIYIGEGKPNVAIGGRVLHNQYELDKSKWVF